MQGCCDQNTPVGPLLCIFGAGGIGVIIIERLRASLYDQVAFVVLNVLVVIFVLDGVSTRVRP